MDKEDKYTLADAKMSSPFSDDILQEARKLIYGDRNDDYGHPRDNMMHVAMLWSTHLQHTGKLVEGCQITPRDVTMMMILMKVARDGTKHKRDNLVDIAGYAGVADRLDEKPVIDLDPKNPHRECTSCRTMYSHAEFIHCPKCHIKLIEYKR